jgi:hypothetical protein
MTTDDLQIEISDMTELDRLELQESLGDKLRSEPQATSPGHLGEPGLLKAIVEISLVAIPILGTSLGIFLARKENKLRYEDKIVIKSTKWTMSRKIKLSASKHDEISAEVIKQINDFANQPNPKG